MFGGLRLCTHCGHLGDHYDLIDGTYSCDVPAAPRRKSTMRERMQAANDRPDPDTMLDGEPFLQS